MRLAFFSFSNLTYYNLHPEPIDGHTLSVAATVAAARHASPIRLDECHESKRTQDRIEKVVKSSLIK
jgi:hypothetical protein